MGMGYLLALQNFRESTGNLLSPFMIWMTKFAVGFWPLAMAAMIFWVFDRNGGRRILAGFGLGVLMNGFLKLVFRVTRPWLKDDRILPYGDSKVSATGYSFPSGHSTYATALFGGMAWWARKKSRVITVLLILAMLITMFSRNYLGVHTPQDVIVGFAATCLMMFLAYRIEDWTDRNRKRDLIVLAGGIVLCIVLAVFYNSLVIKEVYDEAGTLVVDPIKMKSDSYEGIGFCSAYVICRYFEIRYFRFDTQLKMKDRFIIGVFALIPMYWWVNNIFSVISPYSRALGSFVTSAGLVVYILILVPFVMSRICLPQWMKEDL